MKKSEKELKDAYIRRHFKDRPDRIFYELLYHDEGETFVSKLNKTDLSWDDLQTHIEAGRTEIRNAIKGLEACNWSMKKVLRQQPRLILELPESMQDDALWAECIYHMPILIESASHITAPLVYAYCAARKDQVCEYISALTEDELIYAVKEGLIRIKQIPEQRLAKSLVHLASHKILEDNYDMLLDWSVKVDDRLRDAYFYQCMCAVNGYNFRLVPKELREQVVNMGLIKYCIEHQKSYIGTYHLYSALTEEEKTEEISKECCLKHFACVALLPETLKNDAFYGKLLDAGMNDFLYECDYSTLSKETFLRGMDLFNKNHSLKKIPASLLCQETARKAAEFLNGMDVLPGRYRNYDTWMCHIRVHGHHIDRVPEQFLTEEMCAEAYCSHPFRTMEMIPEQFRTPHFYEMVLAHGNYYLSDIPENYISQELVTNHIKKKHPDNLDDVPPAYRIPEVISILAENADPLFLRIPEEYQTPELCRRMIQRMMEAKENWLQFGVFYGQMKYQDEGTSLLLVENLERGLEFIHPQSGKVIERSVEVYPDSIVYAESWWFGSDGMDTENSLTVANEMDKSGEQQHVCGIKQLSIFDFFDF